MRAKKDFKSEFTLERRKEITAELLKKYPNKIPIVCQTPSNSKLPALQKDKLLIDSSLNIGYVIGHLRSQLILGEKEAIFIQVNHKTFPASYTLKAIYAEHASEDGFLYLTYVSEDVYGRGYTSI